MGAQPPAGPSWSSRPSESTPRSLEIMTIYLYVINIFLRSCLSSIPLVLPSLKSLEKQLNLRRALMCSGKEMKYILNCCSVHDQWPDLLAYPGHFSRLFFIFLSSHRTYGKFTMEVIMSTAFGLESNSQTNKDDVFTSNAQEVFKTRLTATLECMFSFTNYVKSFKIQNIWLSCYSCPIHTPVSTMLALVGNGNGYASTKPNVFRASCTSLYVRSWQPILQAELGVLSPPPWARLKGNSASRVMTARFKSLITCNQFN